MQHSKNCDPGGVSHYSIYMGREAAEHISFKLVGDEFFADPWIGYSSGRVVSNSAAASDRRPSSVNFSFSLWQHRAE